jgi:plastocyanin
MTRRRLYLSAVSALLAFAVCGCGNKQPASTSERPAATNGILVDAATAGSVTGTVDLNGTPPKMKPINMAAEPACAKEHSTAPMTQEAIAGKGGALENVVVYLQGDFNKYKFDTPQTPATITQKGCMYDPHIVALETGQEFQVVNADPVTHNIHPLPKDNREWNESQPPGAAPIDRTFSREEIAIPVKCNIHPWMKAYIAVFNNPYFAVTGPDGSFDLKNVPPGTYTVTAWHELYGTSQQSVTIGPNESKTVKIVLGPTAAGHAS